MARHGVDTGDPVTLRKPANQSGILRRVKMCSLIDGLIEAVEKNLKE